MDMGGREFLVSSPGKVILSGEHAVVYGKPALAASLELSTFSRARLSNEDINLHLIEFNGHFQWKIKHVLESMQRFICRDAKNPGILSLEDIQHLQLVAEECTTSNCPISAVMTFLYLYSSICGSRGNDLLPIDVEVASSLPIGAGLGSSASYTSCLSAVMLRIVGLINEDVPSADDLELINKWAFSAEHLLHGKPSGVDNAVSVFGGLIKFQSGVISSVKCPVVLEMILVDTKVQRETKKLVEKVCERHSKWPQIVQPVLDSIGGITDSFQDILTKFDVTSGIDELNELVDMNQGLLSTLGVSHPRLDKVCQLVAPYGFKAKLTGAGGGGCAYFLVPPQCSGLDELISVLKCNDFNCWKTRVGGSGVLMHSNMKDLINSGISVPKYFIPQL